MRIGNRSFSALLVISILAASGCITARRAFDGAIGLLGKAKDALTHSPRTEEDEKAIAEAAKLCRELLEKLRAEGYKPSDIENQSPEDRERIRLCQDILGAMADFAARDPETYNAIIGALSASERSIVLAFGSGDMKAFNAGMKVFEELGTGSEERVYATIELLLDLSFSVYTRRSTPVVISETSTKMSYALRGGSF